MEDRWRDIATRVPLTVDGCTSHNSWGGIFVIVAPKPPEPDGYRGVHLEAPCYECGKGKGVATYRNQLVWIPEDTNTIAVGCHKCEKDVFRVTGLVTHEWQLYLPRRLFF